MRRHITILGPTNNTKLIDNSKIYDIITKGVEIDFIIKLNGSI